MNNKGKKRPIDGVVAMGVMEGQKGGERDEVDKKDDQHLIIISWRDISQNCSIINSKEEKIKLFIIIKQL